MIIPSKKQSTVSTVQNKKRHHCVSFCDDITVVEFECDKCTRTLSVNNPPICVSKNLKNSIFLPQQVSIFFDRYIEDDTEKKTIMTLAREMSVRKYQKKCSLAFTEDSTKIVNKSSKAREQTFLSMTDKERQWLASVQIYQLNETCSSDFYFNKYISKTKSGNSKFWNVSSYMNQSQLENIQKHNNYYKDISETSTHNCLGRIPMFTVAHARRVLDEEIKVQSGTNIAKSNILLTIEHFYNQLLKIEDDIDVNNKEQLTSQLCSQILSAHVIISFMNIEKGQKLYLKLYNSLNLKDQFIFWKNIFQSLTIFFKYNKSTRPLNAFLSLFKIWLMSNRDLTNVIIISKFIEPILSFLIADKFGISVISLIVLTSSNVKRILNSQEVERKKWVMFLNNLIGCIDHHPHVEIPLIGSRKHFVQFLNAIAPSNVHLTCY